jgi:hypothetical protein
VGRDGWKIVSWDEGAVGAPTFSGVIPAPSDDRRKYIKSVPVDPVRNGYRAVLAADDHAARVDAVIAAYRDYKLLRILRSFGISETDKRAMNEWVTQARREGLVAPLQGPDLPPLPHPASLTRFATTSTLHLIARGVRRDLEHDRDQTIRFHAEKWTSEPHNFDESSLGRLLQTIEGYDDAQDVLVREAELAVRDRRARIDRDSGTLTIYYDNPPGTSPLYREFLVQSAALRRKAA